MREFTRKAVCLKRKDGTESSKRMLQVLERGMFMCGAHRTVSNKNFCSMEMTFKLLENSTLITKFLESIAQGLGTNTKFETLTVFFRNPFSIIIFVTGSLDQLESFNISQKFIANNTLGKMSTS